MRHSAPPPPPSPPRRNPSGVGPRGGAVARGDARVEHPFDDDEHERSTANGKDDPSTLDLGAATLPREAPNSRRGRANAIAVSFDDETQARHVDDGMLEKLRHAQAQVHAPGPANVPADLGIDYEALPSLEVRRPYDTFEAEFSERDPVTQLHRPQAHDSAKVRRSDPPPRVAREPSYPEPSYPIPVDSSDVAAAPEPSDHGWSRREESGPRERPVPDARAYAAPAPSYDDVSDSARWARDNGAQPPSGWSSVPDAVEAQPHFPAPRTPVPGTHHPAFVHGVQPLRPPTPDAWGTPHLRHTPVPQAPMHAPMHAMHSSMPPAYAQQSHYGQQAQHAQHGQHGQQAHVQQPTSYAPPPQQAYSQPPPGAAYHGPSGYPAPMHAGASGPMPAAQTMMNRAIPVGAQLGGEGAASKVGRAAWFVAGAAFGITFAFFATGFFSSKMQSDFPAAPPLPPAAVATATTPATPTATTTAPAAIAPPVASPPVAPAAPAVATAPVTTAPVAPAVAPPMMAAPAAFAAPAAPAVVAAAPAARPAPPPAPPARAPRFQPPAPRRPAPPAAPVSQAPKNLGGGGAGADDEPSPRAPSAPAGGGDIGDLLGAGLKP